MMSRESDVSTRKTMIRSAIAGVLCATLTLGCVKEAADATSTTTTDTDTDTDKAVTDKTVTNKTDASKAVQAVVAVKPTWIVYTYDG